MVLKINIAAFMFIPGITYKPRTFSQMLFLNVIHVFASSVRNVPIHLFRNAMRRQLISWEVEAVASGAI